MAGRRRDVAMHVNNGQRYQDLVGIEFGPLSLVSTTLLNVIAQQDEYADIIVLLLHATEVPYSYKYNRNDEILSKRDTEEKN